MAARRSGLVAFVWVCTFVCASLVGGAASAFAASQFGSYGEESEQVDAPHGVAVDAAGNVFVADMLNNRVDKFNGSGNWLLAWGAGVLDGASEAQICTTDCWPGSQRSSPEAFELPAGVAVDDELSSPSYGDVYVVDTRHSRVQKYGPNGEFILMFGGHVNEESAPANPDVCVVGEKCKLYGTQGAADGEFEYWPSYGSFIAVGPGGDVYVGDEGRVQVFLPSGVWKENISLAGLSSTGRPSALAVDPSGDVYVEDEGVAGVREFEPSGAEKAAQFDPGSTTITSLALDPATGHVFVGDSNGGFHVLEYDSSAKELASFGEKTVQEVNGGLAFSGATGELYASEAPVYGETRSSIWAIPVPGPGPLIDGGSATPEMRGAARFEGKVDPEGRATSVHIEYADEGHFNASGFAGAANTPAVSIGSGFADETMSAVLPAGTLTPGTIYYWRAVASSECEAGRTCTSTGGAESFQETPPALIEGPSVSDVAGTSATLVAGIDPLGASTTYRLEYGTSASYGHVLSGAVGEGTGYVPLTRHVQELEASTTYHYRVVTSNAVGTWCSSDRTFTTQATGGEQTLLDGRGWELVSPPNKHGALLEPEPGGEVQAASDGGGIAYGASRPITGEATSNFGLGSSEDQALSVRGATGWDTQEYAMTQQLPEKEDEQHPPFLDSTYTPVFSTDLSRALIEPGRDFREPLSPEATERTLYLRDDRSGSYLPLVTSADVPPGTKFGGGEAPEEYHGNELEMKFIAATPNLKHVVFQSPLRLTPEASEGTCSNASQLLACEQNLYEWSGGRLSLVDVLPDGRPLDHSKKEFAYLGRDSTDVAGAISSDGQRIVWMETPEAERPQSTAIALYERDMAAGETKPIGGSRALFETANSDGSRVFYEEKSELYAFDFAAGTSSDLTADQGPGEHRAGVIDGFVMAASEDGSRVYFAATGVLAPGAVAGQPNLYVSHYEEGAWRTRLIATLAEADDFSKFASVFFGTRLFWTYMDARVSPNGRYLAFMSSRPLTGYDNVDAVSGQPDEEVYLYDARSGRLTCASCDPSGARPIGIGVQFGGVAPLVDRGAFWREHWIAANLPLWQGSRATVQYQRRYLSDSGRLFFNSSDALVAHDTNGLMDVYEFEPPGVGDCSAANQTFSERSGGCVSLISAGTSSGESAFLDASENGDDVFFETASRLVSEDYDTSYDVYDAHVCSVAAPCRTTPTAPPPCTSGDSCKAAPSPQPEIFGPAPSATFSGTGNVASSSRPAARRRSLSRAQRLRRALRACRGKRGRRRRMACVRRARRRYGRARSRSRRTSGRNG